MTENIHAHEHPESDRVREGGFTLWFTGLSGSGKSTIAARRSAPSSTAAA